MNDRRGGFALIAVLWLVVALAILLSTGLRPVRLAAAAAENRMSRTRARWAARACGPAPTSESVALGAATWCSIEPLDWDDRINPNRVDSLGLLRALGDSVRVASILDWIDTDDIQRASGAEARWYRERSRIGPRNAPILAVAELGRVRGFEAMGVDTLERRFAVRGDGSVPPDRASASVLSSISALSDSDVGRLIAVRSARGPFESVEEISLTLGLDPTVDEFRQLVRRLSIRPNASTVRARGWTDLGDRVIRVRLDLDLVTVEGELVISGLEAM